jgi:hypothetical protein
MLQAPPSKQKSRADDQLPIGDGALPAAWKNYFPHFMLPIPHSVSLVPRLSLKKVAGSKHDA